MNFIAMDDGTKLYVELLGEGPPLLMIPGLGTGNWIWDKNKEALSAKFRLIMPELRGSGRSDKPDHHYSIRLFASDLMTVLKKLDINQFHLLGVSMGGFIAQQIAATLTKEVQSVIIACSPLGSENQTGPDGETLCRMIRPRGKNRRERLESSYALNFSKAFMANHARDLEEITRWRIHYPQPEFAYYRQLLAGNAFGGEKYAKRMTAPTLICAGKDDVVVPLKDIYALKNKISHAKFVEFEGRHMFFFENSEKFNRTVSDFLQRNS